MNQPNTPDISFFFAVHQHMRSDLDRYLGSVGGAVESERSTRLRSLHRWTTGFICELEEHHFAEDTFFFPDMRRKVPSSVAIIDGLEADHRRLDELLAAWPGVSANLADPAVPFDGAKSAAVELAGQLRDLLSVHLDIEDHDVLPLYWRHYTAAEYDALQALAVKKSKKKGIWFVAPWNVDNLEGAERAAFLAAAPLPLRAIHRLVRPRYDRLIAAAFGATPVAVGETAKR
ncbi:MAG: hemerythrin domain-containing protein [Actinomycetota bacterium]|nr:hemerythrin domain-containing protein [Actinomycetota bacterium]